MSFLKELVKQRHRPVIIGNELALDVDAIIDPVTSQRARNQFDIVIGVLGEACLLKLLVVLT